MAQIKLRGLPRKDRSHGRKPHLGDGQKCRRKAEEAVGRVTGDLKKQVQGKLDQAAGAAQEFYGQTALSIITVI